MKTLIGILHENGPSNEKITKDLFFEFPIGKNITWKDANAIKSWTEITHYIKNINICINRKKPKLKL